MAHAVTIDPDQQAYRLQLQHPLLLMLVRQQLCHTAQQTHHHPLLLVFCRAALRLMKPGPTAASSRYSAIHECQ
jgi:hypothetical protein